MFRVVDDEDTIPGETTDYVFLDFTFDIVARICEVGYCSGSVRNHATTTEGNIRAQAGGTGIGGDGIRKVGLEEPELKINPTIKNGRYILIWDAKTKTYKPVTLNQSNP